MLRLLSAKLFNDMVIVLSNDMFSTGCIFGLLLHTGKDCGCKGHLKHMD